MAEDGSAKVTSLAAERARRAHKAVVAMARAGAPGRPQPPAGFAIHAPMWIAGRVEAQSARGPVWTLLGVFSCRDWALDACIDRQCFIAPVALNDSFDALQEGWPGQWFPLAGEETGEDGDAG